MKLVHLSLIIGAIRTVGNMSCGSDGLVLQMIQAGVLQQMGALLEHTSNKVQFEAAWAVSNFTASGPNVLSSILESPIIEKLIHLAEVAELDVKKEAIWALANSNSKAELDQMLHLLEKGTLEVFI